ncbi:MAG: enoyl-CoA hydratase [Hyphomicrobiaceae bacterium]
MQDRPPSARSSKQAPAADEAPVLRATDGPVTTVTLNRPNARNALSTAMIAALTAEIHRASDDRTTHAVVLAANGPGFCAGHDLKEMTARRADDDRGRAFFAETMEACATMMQAIVRSPKPFIACVHGVASAAGCQLVATCDLAVASREAKFSTPGVNIGLFCSTPMIALSRNVSRKHAMEMLLLGDMLSAEDAKTFGLVNRVTAHDEVMSEAVAMARQIADKSPLTVAIGKEAFYNQLEQPLADAYDYAAGVMVKNMLARDAEEGIGAFIEKRQPKWRGE